MAERDSVLEEVRGRQALYGGLMGATGVVLAWVVWIVIRALFDKWTAVVLAPTVGALMGLFVDFISRHLEDSAREARGEVAPTPEEATSRDGARHRLRLLLRRMGSFAFVFLAGACENLVGDRIAGLLRPFFISVATFLPVGAVLAWRLHARAFQAHSLGSNVLHGALSGLLAGATALLASLALGTLPQVAGGGWDWQALGVMVGWWTLLGAAFGVALNEADAPSLGGPVVGTVGLLVLIVVAALPAAWTEGIRGPVGLAIQGGRPAADLVLSNPGLPASVLAEAVELSPESSAATGERGESVLGLQLSRLVGCEVKMGVALVSMPPVPSPGLQPSRLSTLARSWQARPVEARETNPRFRVLCEDLRQGSQSGLLRSWLVLVMFSLGLGGAHVLEARTRPRRYEGSGTRRRDFLLFVMALLLWLVSVGAVRLGFVS